jgi:hypothetical protein
MNPTIPPHVIVSCARGWIGTRFSHQGRLKKSEQHQGGVDCLGLLIGVAKELDIRDLNGVPLWQCDDTHYTRTPNTTQLHAVLYKSLLSKSIADISAGDIALLTIQGSPQHLGIITVLENGELGLIHAYAQARKVVEHALDEFWRAQLVAVFSVVNAMENGVLDADISK